MNLLIMAKHPKIEEKPAKAPQITLRAYRVDAHNQFTGEDAKYLQRCGDVFYHQKLHYANIDPSDPTFKAYKSCGWNALATALGSKHLRLNPMPKTVDLILDYDLGEKDAVPKRDEFTLYSQSPEKISFLDIFLRQFKPEQVFEGSEAKNIWELHNTLFHLSVPTSPESISNIAPNLRKFLEDLTQCAIYDGGWTADGRSRIHTLPKTILLSYGFLSSDGI
jgi:hypothetical protein